MLPFLNALTIYMIDFNLGKKCWDTIQPSIEITPLPPVYNVDRDHVVRPCATSLNIVWWGKGVISIDGCKVSQHFFP